MDRRTVLRARAEQAADAPSTPTITAPDGATATLEGDSLALRSPAGKLLFEYRADDGRCLVYAPDGDLELRADNGRIALEAAEGVELRSDKAVRIDAGELTLAARRVRSAVGTLVERIGNVYREVEDLSQTRAGRIRAIARDALQLLGDHAVLKAERDMKIKGDKIHLG